MGVCYVFIYPLCQRGAYQSVNHTVFIYNSGSYFSRPNPVKQAAILGSHSGSQVGSVINVCALCNTLELFLDDCKFSVDFLLTMCKTTYTPY